MAEISKLSKVAIADVAKVDAVLKADIANLNGLTIPSAAAFLLDTYTGASAAYSVRRLNSSYTGACMRVRRDSDDTEQDIGFDSNGDLDTSALATFVGSGNNGYVTTWYGQESSGGTGSGNDATQSTNASQPQIYDGAMITENGKPTLDFDGIDDFLDSALTVNTTDIAVTSVQKFDDVSGGTLSITVSEGSGHQMYLLFNQSNNIWRLNYRGPTQDLAADTNQNLISFFTNSTSTFYYKNGSTLGSAYTRGSLNSTTPMRIGAWSGGGAEADCNIQELVVWEASQSSNRTGIETNVNDYFSIY